MEFKLRPLGDRVVIKPIAREEITKGGVYLPDTASKERPQEGTVIAVGMGRLLEDGTRVPVDVAVGDRVLFAKYSGTEFKREDEEEFIILSEKDILAVIEE
jgi:chaperonin GroES